MKETWKERAVGGEGAKISHKTKETKQNKRNTINVKWSKINEISSKRLLLYFTIVYPLVVLIEAIEL